MSGFEEDSSFEAFDVAAESNGAVSVDPFTSGVDELATPESSDPVISDKASDSSPEDLGVEGDAGLAVFDFGESGLLPISMC